MFERLQVAILYRENVFYPNDYSNPIRHTSKVSKPLLSQTLKIVSHRVEMFNSYFGSLAFDIGAVYSEFFNVETKLNDFEDAHDSENLQFIHLMVGEATILSRRQVVTVYDVLAIIGGYYGILKLIGKLIITKVDCERCRERIKAARLKKERRAEYEGKDTGENEDDKA